jgi:NTE family protein
VDLVQEGGGVHGVALAGYTYVLEKMGIGFMKMAGTSAGSINTLLLNAVYTEQEAKALNKDGQYYETRSEKILEYLANKPLSDLVDGHPLWRKLLLSMFSGKVGFAPIAKNIASMKRRLMVAAIAFLVLVITALGLAFYREQNTIFQVMKWGVIFSSGVLLTAIALLIGRLVFFRLLYKHAERFGINPGKNFEDWIRKDILEKNEIFSVKQLKDKLDIEKNTFNYQYETCKPALDNPAALTFIREVQGFEAVLDQVGNKNVPIDHLFEQIKFFLAKHDDSFKNSEYGMPLIMDAFERRLKAEDQGVTKELIIVSSDITHEIKVEFPGMHRLYWGDDFSISPAKYVRASMSVPFFFKPYQIDFNPGQLLTIRKEWHRYVKVQKQLDSCALLVDGGMLSNFPINVFYNPDIPVPRKPTFGIKLEYEDETAPQNIKSLMGFAGKLVNTMRFFYDRDFILKHDMYQKTVRSIDTGNIHWLNFNLTNEEKVELFFRGALAATLFLAKHAMTEVEVQDMIRDGERVSFNGSTFSIFHNGPVSFRTEDLLIENSVFEWQQYKRDRMMERVELAQLRDNLKGGASLKNADGKEN